MKKYRYSFPKSAFVIYALIVLSSVTAIVFAALRLAGIGAYVTAYPALDIVSICVFVAFIALVGWNLFGAYYAFSKEEFVVVQLFSKKTIKAEEIVKMVVDEASGVAALYFVDGGTDTTLSYVTINVKRKVLDEFIDDLRACFSGLVVEYNPMDKSEQ